MKIMKRKTIVLPEKKLVVHVIEHCGKRFVGKAKCNDDDVFDEEFGQKLAKLRANKKLSLETRKILYHKVKEAKLAYDVALGRYTKETNKFDDTDKEIVIMVS